MLNYVFSVDSLCKEMKNGTRREDSTPKNEERARRHAPNASEKKKSRGGKVLYQRQQGSRVCHSGPDNAP
jgi:hypothetical protein